MQISIQQRKLGEPIGDTLFGKTVSILMLFSILYLLLSVIVYMPWDIAFDDG